MQAFRVAGGGEEKLNELVPAGAYGSVDWSDAPFTPTTPLQVLFVTTGPFFTEIQLPNTQVYEGSILHVKKIDGNTAYGTVFVNTSGSTTVENVNSVTIRAQGEAMSLLCDGTNWHVLNKYTIPDTQLSEATGSSPTFYITEPGNFWSFDTVDGVNVTVYLPDARNYTGYPVTIWKAGTSTGDVIVTRKYSTQTIDGAASRTLANNWESLTVISDGTKWHVFGENS
jgi:hypothetical protein